MQTTPLVCGIKLEKSSASEKKTSLPFRELIGALSYVAIGTRPDIALSQFNNDHGRRHWEAAKRILRYLKGTSDMKLIYSRNDQEVTGYTDADCGNCTIDRKSYSGYAFIISGGAVSFCSRKQKTVALSSTQAKYMSLSEAAKEGIYITTLFKELNLKYM